MSKYIFQNCINRLNICVQILFRELLTFSPKYLYTYLKSLNLPNGQLAIFILSNEDLNHKQNDKLFPDKLSSISSKLDEDGFKSIFLYRNGLSNFSNIRIKKSETILHQSVLFSAIQAMRDSSFASIYKSLVLNDAYWTKKSNLEKYLYYTQFAAVYFLKPKFIFTIGCSLDLLQVCKRLEIEVIEVMHGTFFPDELPISWEIKDKKTKNSLKPNLYLSWHEDYSKRMRDHGINTLTIGYPNSEFLKQFKKTNNRKKQILVTLAWGYVHSADPFGVFANELFSTIKEIDQSKFDIIFRVHPVSMDSKKNFNKIKSWLYKYFPNSQIDSPLENNLFVSLCRIDLHITHDSSTFYEAALLGIPTIFTGSKTYSAAPAEFRKKNIISSVDNVDIKTYLTNWNTVYTNVGKVFDDESYRELIKRINSRNDS